MIFYELQRRHLIPNNNSSVDCLLYYDTAQASPLCGHSTMEQLNFGELFVFQLKYQVRGGTGESTLLQLYVMLTSTYELGHISPAGSIVNYQIPLFLSLVQVQQASGDTI